MFAISAAAQTASPSPAAQTGAVETGKLAWYGTKFAGRRTASGESFEPAALTMVRAGVIDAALRVVAEAPAR